MAFPSSPTNGQIAVQNGITYTYASATNSWTRSPATLPTLSVYTDTFTGDGVTIAFTLSVTPSSADFVSINIDGVSQLKSAYTLLNNIITFTGTPESGAVIEVKSWNAASVGVLTGLTFDNYTGDGANTTYTLSTSPTNKNYTLVTIGGITQEKINYGVSGTSLTFTTAPPNNAPIEVMTFGPAINTATPAGSNTQIQFNNASILNGSANLTFNNVTNTLTVPNITVTGANLGSASNLVITGGSNGYVLTSNGSGGTSWNNITPTVTSKALVMGIIFGG